MRRIFASLLAAATLLLPAAASACGGSHHADMNAIFGTPSSIKGRFVFVERISRRTLLQLVAENQNLYRPFAITAEI